MRVICFRPETDMEMGQRKAREQNARDEATQRERAELERLRAKFGEM